MWACWFKYFNLDKKNKYVQVCVDTEFEKHIFLKIMCLLVQVRNIGHIRQYEFTHLWPCIRGYTGLKEYCSFTDSTCPFEKCHLELEPFQMMDG